jgi:hypothetical protein
VRRQVGRAYIYKKVFAAIKLLDLKKIIGLALAQCMHASLIIARWGLVTLARRVLVFQSLCIIIVYDHLTDHPWMDSTEVWIRGRLFKCHRKGAY